MPQFRLIHPAATVPYVNNVAEAQFTYLGPRGPMHAAMRTFIDKAGVAYTVMWQATRTRLAERRIVELPSLLAELHALAGRSGIGVAE